MKYDGKYSAEISCAEFLEMPLCATESAARGRRLVCSLTTRPRRAQLGKGTENLAPMAESRSPNSSKISFSTLRTKASVSRGVT